MVTTPAVPRWSHRAYLGSVRFSRGWDAHRGPLASCQVSELSRSQALPRAAEAGGPSLPGAGCRWWEGCWPHKTPSWTPSPHASMAPVSNITNKSFLMTLSTHYTHNYIWSTSCKLLLLKTLPRPNNIETSYLIKHHILSPYVPIYI